VLHGDRGNGAAKTGDREGSVGGGFLTSCRICMSALLLMMKIDVEKSVVFLKSRDGSDKFEVGHWSPGVPVDRRAVAVERRFAGVGARRGRRGGNWRQWAVFWGVHGDTRHDVG